MAANPLRPGYRFRPTDWELLNHFLPSKINGDDEAVREIPELHICNFEPWQLSAQSPIETIDNEWFFFYPMDRKYKRGDRLKRATKEGFWKPTGPDRLIKSYDGTVIGTKKTLVFHIGRSPRGGKTIWHMHEYRSVPEQGTLLLGKLIKKVNKKLDGRHDERNIVETNASSFAIAGDIQSEPVTPMMCAQAEKIASTSVSRLPENSDARRFEDHSYIANGAGDLSPDPELDAILGQMIDQEHPDCNILYQSPVEMEVGPSYNYPVANNMDPEHKVQEGTGGQDVEDFLNSIFSDAGMNVAVESEGPSFESYGEVGQEQFETDVEGYGQFNQNNERAPASMEMPVGANRTGDITTEEHFIGQHSVAVASTSNQPNGLFSSPLESGCFCNADGNSDISATGIRVRTRQSRIQPSDRYLGLQGTAPRRIRLQMDFQAGSFYSRNSRELRFEDENHGAKPITAKAEEAEAKYSMPVGHDASKDENIDASLSKPNNLAEVAQKLDLDFKSRSDFPIGDEKETLPVSLKAVSALHWFRYILRVFVILGFSVVFAVVFAAIWRR